MDLSFDHPKLLLLLWLLPVLGGVYLWGFAKKRQALQRFATANLLGTLVPAVSVGRQRVKAILVIAATGFLILALTGPRWGTHWEEVERRGVDTIFVLDVSNSMLAEDVAPNRLERAKLDIKDMLTVLAGDRAGLVTFAGKAVLACPLTINYGAFRLALEDVDTRSSPLGGTNIGDAIRFASECFTDKIKDHKALVVITDGGDTDESYAVEASQKVYEQKGIRVFTVGFGDVTEGARIPVQSGGQRVYMKHEEQEVWSKLDPSSLAAIAAVADGGYFSNADFREIYARIRQKVEARMFETARKEMQYARFHWFAASAFILLMVETLMTDRQKKVSG